MRLSSPENLGVINLHRLACWDMTWGVAITISSLVIITYSAFLGKEFTIIYDSLFTLLLYFIVVYTVYSKAY